MDHRVRTTFVAILAGVLSWGTGCVPPGVALDSESSAARGQAIADQIEEDAAIENFEIQSIPSNPRSSGPAGALYGVVLENSHNSLYMLGTRFPDESVRITGAVLESSTEALILAEEITADGHVRITIPSGDSAEFAVLPAGGLRVTMTLLGSSPPSTLVFEIDADENITIDESASVVNAAENREYDQGSIKWPRAAKPMLAPGVTKLGVAFQQFNCPGIISIVTTVDVTCALWEAVTSQAPTRALDGACLAANGFLEGLRGSDVLPGGQPGAEFAPVAIAKLTLGVNALCAMAKNGWSVGKLLKRASLPDLLCMGVTIVEEGTRVITNGQNVEDAICEALGAAPVSPDRDPVFFEGCDNTCDFAFDGDCDDGGPNSDFSFCDLGTDCDDCGARDVVVDPTVPDCFDDGICNSECPIEPADPDCGDVEFCENFGLCCDGDRICDLARCPEQTDSDCTNFDFCDRLGACCIGDGRCDSAEFPCPATDEDCEDCNNSCRFSSDGDCDDGGPNSDFSVCDLGTDCDDCGARDLGVEPPGDATIAVCPAGFAANWSGDSTPALREMVLDAFFPFSTYHGECRYVRADGLLPDRFLSLGISWTPPSAGTPSGACESADLGDIVSENCCTRSSTRRTIEVAYVLSTPIVDGTGAPARNAVLDELLTNAVQAGVGAECPSP